ncbi:MAG: hypothetical protein KF767_06175 [Bdellovibrionaceae bacterium]|nr:hypothetical protein [Pseudobdellovibrionaceae bacterium]
MKVVLSVMALVFVFAINADVASAKGKGKGNSEAKQACLQKDPSLSGKKLKKCIKNYRK